MGPNPRRQPLRLPLRMRRSTRRDDAKKQRLIFVHHAPPSSVTRHPRRRPSDHTPASSAASRHAASHAASSSGVSGRDGRREGRENRLGFSTRAERRKRSQTPSRSRSQHARQKHAQPACESNRGLLPFVRVQRFLLLGECSPQAVHIKVGAIFRSGRLGGAVDAGM
jgi:hypothetical protein